MISDKKNFKENMMKRQYKNKQMCAVMKHSIYPTKKAGNFDIFLIDKFNENRPKPKTYHKYSKSHSYKLILN